MSALGHKRTYAVQEGMSALPPKADIRRHVADQPGRAPLPMIAGIGTTNSPVGAWKRVR